MTAMAVLHCLCFVYNILLEDVQKKKKKQVGVSLSVGVGYMETFQQALTGPTKKSHVNLNLPFKQPR